MPLLKVSPKPIPMPQATILQNAVRTFAHLRVYPCDLCGIFMQGMHPHIKAAFEEL
jgi:hypothetical protein